LNDKLIEFGIYQLTAKEELFPVGGNGRKVKPMMEISVQILFEHDLIIVPVKKDFSFAYNNVHNELRLFNYKNQNS